MTTDRVRATEPAHTPVVATEPPRRRAPLVPASGTSTNQGLDLTVGLLAAIGTYGVLGWWADGWLGTTPWLLVAGVLLGFVCGLYLLAVRTRAEVPTSRRDANETDDMEDDTA